MKKLKGLNFKRGSLKKVLILILAGFVFCSFAESAEDIEGMTISSVKVAGNLTISDPQVLSLLRTKQGESFVSSVVNEDVVRIADIKGVDRAYYNTKLVDGTVELTYVVIEKEVVKSIVFNGNEKFKDSVLSSKVGFKRGQYADKFVVESGKESILEFYRKKGYVQSEVAFDEDMMSQGLVVYNIKEGERAKIQGIQFIGNKTLKSKELKKAIKTKRKKFWLFNSYYQQEVVDQDAVKIITAYQKRGFLDVKVTSGYEFVKNGKVIVEFNIDEGPVYQVEQITVSGNQFFTTQELTGDIQLVKGQPYSYQKAEHDQELILKKYRETGFVDAEVRHVRKFLSDNTVLAQFEIQEGNRFRIGQVNIAGNKDTQDKVFRRILDEYKFKPGQWYDADKARGNGRGELETTVKNQAMAESVLITPTGDNPESKDAQVDITEGQTGMVMLGAGIDSSSGVIGQFVFEQRNFDIHDKPESLHEFITGKAYKGAGQKLRLSLEPGTEYSQFSLSFTEPYFRDKPISLDVVGSSYEREQESYNENRTKGYVGFEKRYEDGWRRSIGFRLENVKVDSLDADAPKEIVDVEGNNLLAGVKFGITRDMTDNRFNPTSGKIFDVSYEQVAGDYTFGILGATAKWFKTLREDLADRKTVLSSRLRAATTIGDAPPFEKFYAGGIGSIRGFDYRGVSTRGKSPVDPSADGDPIGSDWILLANAEVAVPLASDTFAAIFFVDSGMIDTGGIRASVGTGIQILIPQWFGPVPMRFEFAAPFLNEDEDETQVFSFSVGRLF